MKAIAAIAAVVLLIAAPGTAAGATVQTGFDEFVAGTPITQQVPGMTFPDAPVVFAPAKVSTASAPHALQTNAPCDPNCKNGAGQLRMTFDTPAAKVAMKVGLDTDVAEPKGTWARLVGYDADGKPVADSGDVLIGTLDHQPIATPVAVDAAAARIATATMFVGAGMQDVSHDTGARRVEVDDVVVERPDMPPEPPPPAPPPRPRISLEGLVPSGFYDRAEDALAAGFVDAPGGVRAFCVVADHGFEPRPDPCPDAALLRPTSTDTYRYERVPVRGLGPGFHLVTAWVEDEFGQVARDSFNIEVASAGQIDLRVKAVEVTQGTQVENLPFVFTPGVPVAYNGVQLAQQRMTVVRVFANAGRTGRIGTPVQRVPLALYGFHELPDGSLDPLVGAGDRRGAPILPQTGVRDLGTGPANVPLAERVDPAGAYTFVLPRGWTYRGSTRLTRLRLVAEVNPEAIAPVVPERAADRANNRYTLTGIPFNAMRPIVISPVSLTFRSAPGGPITFTLPPAQVFAATDDLLPLTDRGLVVRSYQAQLDISDIAMRFLGDNAALDAVGAEGSDPRRLEASNRANDAAWDRMVEWERGHDQPGIPVGINAGIARGLESPVFFLEQLRADQIAVADENRPITSVAHETTHALRIRHAGPRCGAGGTLDLSADAWPPDDQGRLQGVGLDPRPVAGQPPGTFRIYAERGLNPPLYPGQRSVYYDLMSYCGSNEGDFWISPRTWNSIVDGVRYGGALPDFFTDAYVSELRSRGTTGSDALDVVALVAADGTLRSLRVAPASGGGAGSPAGTESPFAVVVRDRAGQVVSETRARTGEALDSGSAALTATVPGAGAAIVELVRSGTVLGRVERSASPPRVELSTPRAGASLPGRGQTAIRFAASDPDGDTLRARIDYSADGGRSFRPLTVGVTGGSWSLPNGLLTRSDRARLRVTVSDGFNEASALSLPFRAEGTPPTARIESPGGGVSVMADAPLSLSGSAVDDRGLPLGGRALRWFDGRRPVGSGGQLEVGGLAPGRHRFRLVARDRFGREGSASVNVRVVAVTPRFVGLRAPARLGKRARRLTLRTGSTVPARLPVRGRRFDVGARPRRIVVPVPADGRPVALRLVLAAGRERTAMTITVPRR